MNKKLSIITINYNNQSGLQRTVESILSQTWSEFEYIVIDGGSTDGSVAYLENQSAIFDYWVSEKDLGIYNAMNKGIKAATGQYLLFLNSGDELFNDEVLALNHHYLEVSDLVYFNLKVVDRQNTFIKKYPKQLFFSYFIKDSLPHPATFIKATLFDLVGNYDEDFKIVSDWKFFIECICKFNVSYTGIDATLSTFYSDGLSSQIENSQIITSEKELILNSIFPAFIEDVNELFESKTIISNLRKSKKIQLLTQFGLLRKF